MRVAASGKRPYIVVVGAVNMDICGRARRPLLARDSNPGTVSVTLGGVGRNIAHNLRLMEMEVEFLTAFGEDLFADNARRSCRGLGIGVDHALTVPGGGSSAYLYITGPDGDMELAVADTVIAGHIDPGFLSSRRELIEGAAALVFDGNLSEDSAVWLRDNCSCPLLADPVSAAKAPKLLPALDGLYAVKPNRLEAEALTGCRDPEAAVLRLYEAGVRHPVVSLGEQGAAAVAEGRVLRLEGLPCRAVDTTGAGDAFMAALAARAAEGMAFPDSLRCAMAAGAIAAESPGSISPYLSRRAVRERAGI